MSAITFLIETADAQLVQMSAPNWTIATVRLFTKSAGISHSRYGSPLEGSATDADLLSLRIM